MLQVLRISGFLAFLSLAFLNAFVDLGHKIIIQNTIFKIYDGSEQVILTAIVNALILLPFILAFSPSGFVADKYCKPQVMRYSAWAAVLLTLLITLGYYQGWFWFSFAMTFLLALQSAFYSPAKYGYIKELIGEKKLAQGNAFVQSVTMIAILISTFLFAVLFEVRLESNAYTTESDILQFIAPLGWVLVGLSLLETLLAYQLPMTPAAAPEQRYAWQDYVSAKSSVSDINYVHSQSVIWLSIIGIAVFWSLAQVILAIYPSYIESSLNIHNTAYIQGLMACSGIGILIGSLIAGRVSKHHIETGLVPISAVGVFFTIGLITWWPTMTLQALNFLVLGIMGGLFVVPLNALMQYHAENNQLGRILATNNLIQNIAMLGFLVGTVALSLAGVSSLWLFSVLTVIAAFGAIYTIYHLPESLLQFVAKYIFKARYRLKVLGFENLPARGGVLLLGNHISWIDWALVQIASPRRLHFVMERGYYERWYLKWVLDLFKVVPIRGVASNEALKKITQLLNEGEVVCLFPEGTISRTGQLGEFKKGYEKAIADTEAVIVPFYLHGLWGSRFSRSSGFLRANRQSGFKRDIIVSFGKPLSKTTDAVTLKQAVFELSMSSWQEYSRILDPVTINWLRVSKRRGMGLAAADVLGDPISHHRFMTGVFRFAKAINRLNPEPNVGLLLPTSVGSALANMAVFTLGKTVVNLNFTASTAALRHAATQTGMKRIFTSQKFVEKLKERNIQVAEIFEGLELVYLEDIKASIPKYKMIMTLLAVNLLPAKWLQWRYVKQVDLEETAAILFSSGSESLPKAIMLSHRNIAANVRQVADTLNTRDNDVLMGTLPTFHAFGFLATTMLPLAEGIPLICHPDPTDGLNIAKGVARYEATVLFGTATFLRLYARNNKIHPLMFQPLRLVVAGAEKLTPEVRRVFNERFGKMILEGYGATELSPVAAVNIPDELDSRYWFVQQGNRPGTVGLPLPGTCFRVVDPDSLAMLPIGQDGLILISGPQVMKGYLDNPELTAKTIIELEGTRWYKTGDKGHIDEDGFLTIVDRYSRFAKLGGEMISLTAIEMEIRQAMENPDMDIVAVNLADDKKGEKVVLLVSLLSGAYEAKDIRAKLVEKQINPLMLPANYYMVEQVPKLGSGKTDFAAARQLALQLEQSA
ncbi:MAG: acyl-[ACP]--phospholipid O-acyltransferase [Thiofilum sp.]|uniref:acyl-[ACP]--phospholipid O-acyltransferase n=1 Tax=Thiofilum sp. TaxID=2212733 RepID=UPI0025F174F0|nr:acyl-[ACP]--phospholipid O-acyltransferase [Thiofilum sp.]MBK8454341.1 acyl-[ACP]--phospholipid O-acyltransferase [Thiofilum sp.]